ncbi:MAG: hypothetical protein RR065_08810 [Clostridia bacterium]
MNLLSAVSSDFFCKKRGDERKEYVIAIGGNPDVCPMEEKEIAPIKSAEQSTRNAAGIAVGIARIVERKLVDGFCREAWGWVEYDHPLTTRLTTRLTTF